MYTSFVCCRLNQTRMYTSFMCCILNRLECIPPSFHVLQTKLDQNVYLLHVLQSVCKGVDGVNDELNLGVLLVVLAIPEQEDFQKHFFIISLFVFTVIMLFNTMCIVLVSIDLVCNNIHMFELNSQLHCFKKCRSKPEFFFIF